MYPYLADFDSDGYDDIEPGEEDNFVRWDPVNGVHVLREIPLASTEQNKADEGSATTPEDNNSTQLLRREIGLGTFLGSNGGSVNCGADESLTQSFAGGHGSLDIPLKTDAEIVAIPEDNVPSTQILGDQIGLSILLKAAKAVSENGQDEGNSSEDLFKKHGDAREDEVSVVSDSVRYILLFTSQYFPKKKSNQHLRNEIFFSQVSGANIASNF